jgi:hypothetical protein
MNTNEIIANFRNVILSIFDNLAFAKITPADEEWESITSVLFANLVCMPLELENSYYAFYSAEYESHNNIVVTAEVGTECLLGIKSITENGLGKKITWENYSVKSLFNFEFREFSNPMHECEKLALSYVIGQCRDTGNLVCLPYEKVSFKVSNA